MPGASDIPELVRQLSSWSDATKEGAATQLSALAHVGEANQAAIANAGGIPPLVQLLRSTSSTCQQQASAALWDVARHEPNQAAIAAAGGIQLLVRLLGSTDSTCQENAAGALRNLSWHGPNQAAIAAAGGIQPLVQLLGSTDISTQVNAAGALGALAEHGPNQAAIAAAGGIQPLVQLLGSTDSTCQWAAAGALWNLAVHGPNQAAIAAAGGIQPLVRLLGSTSSICQVNAAGALGALAEHGPNQAAIAAALVPLLRSTDSTCQVKAAGALKELAVHGPSQAAIAAAGGIQPLVQLLGSTDTNTQVNAAGALGALADGHSANQAAIAAAGGIPALRSLLDSSNLGVRKEAAGALRQLEEPPPAHTPATPPQPAAQQGVPTPQPMPPQPPRPAPPSAQLQPQGTRSALSDPLLWGIEQMMGQLRVETEEGSGSAIPQLEPWRIEFRELQLQDELGEGSFGRVYCALFRQTPVAVKVLLGAGQQQVLSLSDPLLRNLQREASLMVALRHPNIVSLLKVCAAPAAIITEYCSKGSLADVLERAAADPAMGAQITWRRRLGMLVHAARGLCYLHGNRPAVIHRDVKSPNLLVDEHWNVKVGDFNLSKFLIADNSRSSRAFEMNPRWLAPEVLNNEPATTQSDVFGFGVVMWEVLTWKQPWADVRMPWQISAAVSAGRRLEVPPTDQLPGPDTPQFGGLDEYVCLMQRCWAQDPAQRPAFDDITALLTSLQDMAPAPASAPQPAPSPAPAPAGSAAPQEASPPRMSTCAVCLDEFLPTQLVVFIPCGHRATCRDCAERLLAGPSRLCPIDRREITTFVEGSFRVFSC